MSLMIKICLFLNRIKFSVAGPCPDTLILMPTWNEYMDQFSRGERIFAVVFRGPSLSSASEGINDWNKNLCLLLFRENFRVNHLNILVFSKIDSYGFLFWRLQRRNDKVITFLWSIRRQYRMFWNRQRQTYKATFF